MKIEDLKIPQELKKYKEYVESLKFEDKPNYEYLKGLFTEALKSNNL